MPEITSIELILTEWCMTIILDNQFNQYIQLGWVNIVKRHRVASRRPTNQRDTMAFEDYLPDRLRETYSVKIGLIFLLVVLMTVLVSALFWAHVSGTVGPAAEDHFSDRTADRSDVAAAWLETNAETASGLAADATVQEGPTLRSANGSRQPSRRVGTESAKSTISAATARCSQ